ncbi:MAG: NAD(P)-dependent oxidoreductase, partial [Cyanobacteria bacterium P01_C01_bin.72]
VRQNSYDAILGCYEDCIDEPLLQAAGDKLKLVSVMSNGIENVDLAACQKYGVKVANVPGVTTDAIADYAIALLLMGIRRLDRYLPGEQDSVAPYYYLGNLHGFALSQLTIGIVGMGQIGRAIAKRLVGFGSRTVYCSRQPKPELEQQYSLKYLGFEQLLSDSDAIIICCSLNESTRNLFAASAFKTMKQRAILLNLARGEICNQDDLYHALSEESIAMALLDVTAPEPLPRTHPLHQLDNCLIFPHIATNTEDSRREICDRAWQQILTVLLSASGETICC